jgi:glycosyltransferase involved in cell wall biosynthesis
VKPLRALVLYAQPPGAETLSYQVGWPQALRDDPGFDATFVDVRAKHAKWAVRAALLRRPDAVVALHSVFSNECYLVGRLVEHVVRFGGKKVLFMANEYKFLPEKLAFAEALEADLVVSQLSSERALDLYRSRLRGTVISIPNTGFDPGRIHPAPNPDGRPIDLGYRAYDSPLYLGHSERTDLAETFADLAAARGLTADISLEPAARLSGDDWYDFLNRCKGQLGSEAGGDFFELDDGFRIGVTEHLERNPDATLEELRERFFDRYPDPVSGRALSGRIVEAAATKTVQILIAGDYGSYFVAGEHYIPVRADLSDAAQALDRFADLGERERVREAAYAVAIEHLTWPRLVGRLREAIADLV